MYIVIIESPLLQKERGVKIHIKQTQGTMDASLTQ